MCGPSIISIVRYSKLMMSMMWALNRTYCFFLSIKLSSQKGLDNEGSTARLNCYLRAILVNIIEQKAELFGVYYINFMIFFAHRSTTWGQGEGLTQ